MNNEKVIIGGITHSAEPIDFEIEEEPWNLYRITIGETTYRVRMRVSISKIIHIGDMLSPDGTPVIQVMTTPLAVAVETIKKK